MDISDSLIQSIYHEVIEIDDEPQCSIERTNITNEVRKSSAESTHNNAKRIKLNPVPETEEWNSDCNKDITDDTLGKGEASTQDISNAFEEDASKRIKDPNSEVGKSKLTRNPLTGKESVDEKMKGQRMTMTSIENFHLDSTEVKAPLNVQNSLPQTGEIAKGIQGQVKFRKRLASDTVEDVTKKKKVSVGSQTLNEDSLIATDQQDENTVPVNVSSSSKTIIKSSDLAQGSLHREVVNEVSTLKDTVFICQPSSSSSDCSLLKYFRLNTEIRDEELTEIIDYFSKLCPKNDSSAVFFENSGRKLIKNSKLPISLASGHAFLSILSQKLKCNSTAELNLKASTSIEVDLNDEDSSSLSSIKELVKILPMASVSSACLDNSNFNDSVNSISTDQGKLFNVPDFTLHIPHSEENWSSLPNEEAKIKPTAICGPILCSELGTICKVASDRNISHSLSTSRQPELFFHDMKKVFSKIDVMLQPSQCRYSQLLSGNDQPTLLLNRNCSKESDNVQILSKNQTASISTDHGPTSRSCYSEKHSALVTSKELNCVTCTEPVIEEMQCLSKKSALDPRHSDEMVSEIPSAETTTQEPELSESSEKSKIGSIEPVGIKEIGEMQCLNGKTTVFNDTTHSPETYSVHTSMDGQGVSESNEKLQNLSMTLVKECEYIPNSASKDSQSSSVISTEGEVIEEINLCEMSSLKKRNIDDQNNSFTNETFEDEVEENISSPIHRNKPNVQNDKYNFSEQSRNTVNSGDKNDAVEELIPNVSDNKMIYARIFETSTAITSETFEDEEEESISSPVRSNQPNVQNDNCLEQRKNDVDSDNKNDIVKELIPNVSDNKMIYARIVETSTAITSETFEDEEEESISSSVRSNQPNGQNDNYLKQRKHYVDSGNSNDTVKESLNVSDPKMSSSRIIATSTAIESDIEDLESIDTQDEENKSIEFPLMSKFLNNNLTISVTSGSRRIVRAREPNILYIVPLASSTLKSQTQRQEFNFGEASHSEQVSQITNSSTSRTNPFIPNIQKSKTSENRSVQMGENIPTISNLARTSLEPKNRRNSYLQMCHAPETFIAEDNEENFKPLTHVELPKRVSSEVDSMKVSSDGISSGERKANRHIPKSNPARRTSVEPKKRRNSYLPMSHALEDNENFKAPTHAALPKRVSLEVDSTKASDSIFFGERKGNRSYLAERSYKNVGKTFITNDDLPSLILEWNATWLSTQDETKVCAPICDKYYHVKDRYADELDYYNTFFPLHLLSIWLRISDSWKKNTETFESVFETETDLRNAVKITCYTALNPDRCASWIRREDILLCRALKPGGGVKELFGRVCNVIYSDYETEDMYCGTSSRLKKVTFQFLCAEPLDIPNLITVKIQILGNIRTALLQNDALQYLNGVTKDLILNPENHRSSMNFISLYPRHHKAFPKCKKDIIDSIMSPDVHVTMVDALVPWDITFVTLQLAVTLIKSDRPVLIGVRDVATLIEFAAALKRYNLILAVKRSEVRLPDDLRRFTLDDRCRLLNREVFFKCHVTLTLLSGIYMGDLGDAIAEQQVTCILPEAHLCTETESALLLYYDVKHLVLIGRNERNPNLHSVLKRFGYDISLFNRLYKAKPFV